MAGEMMGVTPVYDVNNGMDNGFGGSWIWVFFLFIILCWGGNGFGGFGNNVAANEALTRAEMFEGFNFNDQLRKLDNLSAEYSNGLYAQTNAINNAVSGINSNICKLSQEVQQSRFDTQNCCCETNRNIDNLRYDNAQNTCKLENAIHAEAESTRALINSIETQNLRERLENKDRELMTANFQLSQQAQTTSIIDSIRPVSRPAYITCSPYESNFCGYGC